MILPKPAEIMRITYSLIITILLFVVSPHHYALANDHTEEIFRAEKDGGFEIVVGIQPKKPIIGTVHFSVTLSDINTKVPISDAKITLMAEKNESHIKYQARALNFPSSPNYYETNITFKSAGLWTLIVSVQMKDVEESTFIIPLDIGNQSITPGTAGNFVFLAVLILLSFGIIYIFRKSKHRHNIATR